MDKVLILKKIINKLFDGKNSELAKKIGVTPQTISTWITRKTFDIELIFAKCEVISANFLLTGEEPMLKNDEPINKNQNNESFDFKFLKEQNHELMLKIDDLNQQIGSLRNELQNYRQEYDNKSFSA